MKTSIGSMIRVTDPSPELVAWTKSNLVFPNPEYEKKQQMGLWVGRTPREIRMYEWRGDTLVLPFGVCRRIMPYLDGPIETEFTQDDVINYGAMDCLYGYQEEAKQGLMNAKFGILKSAAGSGKTQIGIALIQAWKKKALWLCHTADLLRQSRERAEMFIPKELIGTITEGKVKIGKGVTFATVQTMCNLDLPSYRNEWDVIVIDECHRVSAGPNTFTRYQKVLNNLCARHKYGLTATLARSDGLVRSTIALIGDVAWEVPDDAVKDKIMQVGIKRVGTDAEISEDCLNDDGTINYTHLITHLSEDPERNKLIARKIMEEKGHSCLILAERIAHLERIRNLLPYEMQEKSVIITGKMVSKTEKAERQAALDQMRSGEKQYLFATYALAKEGLDVQRLDRLFLASPIKFYSIVVQSIGRVARTCEGKEMPVVFDFVDGNIGFCVGAWKKRCTHYRKSNAIIL